MELDATTFVLEVVNFLVLVWLLRRFLYAPVQAALAARADAQARRNAALAARERELAEAGEALARERARIDEGRAAAEQALAAQIAAERQRRLAALAQELEAERTKALARAERDAAQRTEQDERALRARAAGFVADYLRRLAGPALETAVIELFLADLAAQAEAARAALGQACAGAVGGRPAALAVEVATAFPVAPALRARVEAALAALVGASADPAAPPWQVQWRLDPALQAGIRVHLPGHQLEASLARGVDAYAATPAADAASEPTP